MAMTNGQFFGAALIVLAFVGMLVLQAVVIDAKDRPLILLLVAAGLGLAVAIGVWLIHEGSV